MEVSKLKNKISDIDTEEIKLATLTREYEILSVYDKDDRVISSEEALKELKADGLKPIFKIKSDIPKLDELIGDFRSGQVIVISAPTGQGKTTFAQTLTYSFSEQKTNCIWFSYEVGLEDFMEKMPNAPIFYLPRRIKQNSLSWVEMRIKESIVKYDAKVVFIDHLHYLLEMQKMAEAKSISLLVGMMMRELKKIALENEIIIFLISHMRKVKYEENALPDIDDLRDSSFVGQEADMVLFLHRIVEEIGGSFIFTHNAILKVAKNRRLGNLGYVKLELVNGRFRELTNAFENEK